MLAAVQYAQAPIRGVVRMGAVPAPPFALGADRLVGPAPDRAESASSAHEVVA